MNISLLKSYITVARHLNFTEAAKELCITQPTLSKQIALVEKEAGALLIERSKSQPTLTHAGIIYFEGAGAILARYEKMLADIAALTETEGGSLSVVGFLFGSAQSKLQAFRQKYPSVFLKVEGGFIPGQINEVLTKDTDVCFGIFLPQLAHEGIDFQPFNTIRFCVVVDKNHRLTHRDKVEASELNGETFIYRFRDSSDLYRGFTEMFASHGISANFEMRYASNMSEIFIDMRGSLLLWVSSSPLPGIPPADIRVVEIEDESFTCEYGLWYRKDSNNPLLPLFLNEFS